MSPAKIGQSQAEVLQLDPLIDELSRHQSLPILQGYRGIVKYYYPLRLEVGNICRQFEKR